MTRTVQPDGQPVALTCTDDVIVAILRFHPDRTASALRSELARLAGRTTAVERA